MLGQTQDFNPEELISCHVWRNLRGGGGGVSAGWLWWADLAKKPIDYVNINQCFTSIIFDFLLSGWIFFKNTNCLIICGCIKSETKTSSCSSDPDLAFFHVIVVMLMVKNQLCVCSSFISLGCKTNRIIFVAAVFEQRLTSELLALHGFVVSSLTVSPRSLRDLPHCP